MTKLNRWLKRLVILSMQSVRISIYKTLTWRVLATVVTFCVAYFITGNTIASLSIMGIDGVIKMVFYYLHERFWNLGGEL